MVEAPIVVDSIQGIDSIDWAENDAARFALPDRAVKDGWLLFAKSNEGHPSVTLEPGQSMSVQNLELIGYGANRTDYVRRDGDYLVIRQRSWFYDVTPGVDRLVRVKPYAGADAGSR